MMSIPSHRCQASLSAEVYKKRSKADGTYDHATWLRYDGNHVRCRNPTKMMRRGSGGWVGLCGLHDAVVRRRRQYFPYLPAGETCHEPCCLGDREVWQVGVWTPSERLAPTAAADRDKRLRDLYRKAADTSLLMIDPDDL